MGEEAPLAGVPNLALRAERAPNAKGAEQLGYTRDYAAAVKAAESAAVVLVLDDPDCAVETDGALIYLGTVLGNDAPEASLPGEVCYSGEWYDYESKYGAGHTTFKVPAPLGSEVTARVRELAIRAFKAIDCAGLARVDFFIEGEAGVLVNEINTLPGFTPTSAAENSGWTVEEISR